MQKMTRQQYDLLLWHLLGAGQTKALTYWYKEMMNVKRRRSHTRPNRGSNASDANIPATQQGE
jgi:hypothetical protein